VTVAPLQGTTDEELTIASAVLPLIEADLVARRAAKSGGAEWSDELRGRARAVQTAILPFAPDLSPAQDDASFGVTVAFALDAIEAWLAARGAGASDSGR